MVLTSKQRITKIVEKWYIIEPLYFSVWTTHELVISSTVENIRTGRGKIEYNPQFIESLSDKDLYTVLGFEAMRIILKHPYSRRKEIPELSYTASNITIQEYLKTTLNFPYAKDVFYTTEYDQRYFEFYYFKLLELADKQNDFGYEEDSLPTGEGESQQDSAETIKQEGESLQEKDGSTGEQKSMPSDDSSTDLSTGQIDKDREYNHLDKYTSADVSGKENTAYWESDNFMSDTINEKIHTAMESNSWGSIPYYITDKIIATLKPKLNYRQILKSFRGSILSANRVLTRMKPSRRYGFLYMGSRRDFCTKLLCAVDVSGSISNGDLRKAFSVINQLFKYGIEAVDVIQFDTEIKGELLSLKKARHEVKVIGRGGTSFEPVIDYINKDRSYDGLIIYTDGYASVPSTPINKRTRILWLFNNEDNYERTKDSLRHIGKSAFIKES